MDSADSSQVFEWVERIFRATPVTNPAVNDPLVGNTKRGDGLECASYQCGQATVREVGETTKLGEHEKQPSHHNGLAVVQVYTSLCRGR